MTNLMIKSVEVDVSEDHDTYGISIKFSDDRILFITRTELIAILDKWSDANGTYHTTNNKFWQHISPKD